MRPKLRIQFDLERGDKNKNAVEKGKANTRPSIQMKQVGQLPTKYKYQNVFTSF